MDTSSVKTPSLGVVLIDMQEVFLEELIAGSAEVIIPNQQKVIRICKEMDIPVVVLEYAGWGPTKRELMELVHCNRRSEVLEKNDDNGFSHEGLHVVLKTFGVKSVFFMGINATACVLNTARGALEHGYGIVTAHDVISGRHHHPHDHDRWWWERHGEFYDSAVEFF